MMVYSCLSISLALSPVSLHYLLFPPLSSSPFLSSFPYTCSLKPLSLSIAPSPYSFFVPRLPISQPLSPPSLGPLCLELPRLSGYTPSPPLTGFPTWLSSQCCVCLSSACHPSLPPFPFLPWAPPTLFLRFC